MKKGRRVAYRCPWQCLCRGSTVGGEVVDGGVTEWGGGVVVFCLSVW